MLFLLNSAAAPLLASAAWRVAALYTTVAAFVAFASAAAAFAAALPAFAVVVAAGESLDRVLLVGDSLQTDIAFAAAAALKSCLCLTGVTDGVLLRSAFAAAKLDSSTNTSNNSSNGREQQQPKAVLPDFIIDTAANLCPKPHSS